MVDFGKDMLIFNDRGFLKLIVNGANHYMMKMFPANETKVSFQEVRNTSATNGRDESSVEGGWEGNSST